jgi:hypothetical protein
MSLHALDAIDDALTATVRYRPRGLFEWIWLAVVALFVGRTGIALPTGGAGGNVTPEQRAAIEEAVPATLPQEAWMFATWVIGGVVVGWVLYAVVSAFLEFPFLRWLRDGDLALVAESVAHWKGALGLAVFRLLVSGLSLAATAGIVFAVVGPDAHPVAYLLALTDVWYVIAAVSLVIGVVTAFTTAFVVPAMWLEERGVLSGWRRVWPALTGAPKQFLAYAVLVAILALIGGIVILVAALAGFLPGLIVGLLVGAVAGGHSITIGLVIGGILAFVLGAVASALVQTYLRYYALFVLGDVDDDLDAIPGRRREVRADGGKGGEDDAEPGDAADEDGVGDPTR